MADDLILDGLHRSPQTPRPSRSLTELIPIIERMLDLLPRDPVEQQKILEALIARHCNGFREQGLEEATETILAGIAKHVRQLLEP
jgi:hypothetical protein